MSLAVSKDFNHWQSRICVTIRISKHRVQMLPQTVWLTGQGPCGHRLVIALEWAMPGSSGHLRSLYHWPHKAEINHHPQAGYYWRLVKIQAGTWRLVHHLPPKCSRQIVQLSCQLSPVCPCQLSSLINFNRYLFWDRILHSLECTGIVFWWSSILGSHAISILL